jgi:antibiotic biosynthesis monooxygenase (ABM) superfamily enzyme
MISEREFPGYLGTTVIAPGGNVSSMRYVINRFANQASLDAWENSKESLKLLEEAQIVYLPESYWYGDVV